MKSFSLLTAAVLIGSAMAEIKKIGCYNSIPANAVFHDAPNNSRGGCGTDEFPLSIAFAVSNRTNCYCLDEVPPASAKVADNKCNLSCPGYPDDNCK